MEFLDLKATDLVSRPTLGDILICGGCGFPSKVTLEGTALMSDAEFRELSKEEVIEVNFAQRAIKRNVRNQ